MGMIQINKHFGVTTKLNLTLEKLQIITTTPMKAKYKTWWLGSWNSSSMTRKSVQFPLGDVEEFDLEILIIWASFWAWVQFFPLFSIDWRFYYMYFFSHLRKILVVGGGHDEWVQGYEGCTRWGRVLWSYSTSYALRGKMENYVVDRGIPIVV